METLCREFSPSKPEIRNFKLGDVVWEVRDPDDVKSMSRTLVLPFMVLVNDSILEEKV